MSLITSFKTLFEKKPVVQDGELFRHLQEVYPTLNEAAGDLLRMLSDRDFKGDLTLSAQMAGLKMLRNSGADPGKFPAGTMLLGAVSDEAHKRVRRFMYSWYLSNGMAVEDLRGFHLPVEDMAFLPQVAALEPKFDAACREHRVRTEDTPYAAALAAMKLVSAGGQLGLMDLRTAQYIVQFHILAASKTVPGPAA